MVETMSNDIEVENFDGGLSCRVWGHDSIKQNR